MDIGLQEFGSRVSPPLKREMTAANANANAECHKIFLCWSRAVKSGVNQGLYLFFVLYFFNQIKSNLFI